MTLSAWRARERRRWAYALIALVFVYTTIANIAERPDGVKIAACFIAGIVVVSVMSRLGRSFELRTTSVELDPVADRFLREAGDRDLRLIAKEPDRDRESDYRAKLCETVADNDLPDARSVIFVEVTVADPSDFETALRVGGEVVDDTYRVLSVSGSSVPNALAALLLYIRDRTGRRPHVYVEWTEGNPLRNLLRYLVLGDGEVAPVTREILRRQEPDRARRPHVHAG